MALYNYITTTGVIVPDTSELQSDVETEFQNALGSDLVVTPDTPQGALITAETIARDAVVRNNAALANQINPKLAGGVFLDALCALTDLDRDDAERSLVTATLTGVAGTIIPALARAQTVEGELFELQNGVVLNSFGTATGIFQSVNEGPIGALVGDLNQIVDGVIGWENVTNPTAAILGQYEQSDQSLRALRPKTLALQGSGLAEAITSALYATEGVRSLKFRENVTNATATIDGVSLVAHSVYACVDGGTDVAVATTLLKNKSGGCAWNGGLTVSVVDEFSGQTYDVIFSRPTAVPILIRATVKSNSVLLDPVAAVKTAILAYVNGEMDGEDGFTVGASVSSFELASAVNRQTPGIYVQNMEISNLTPVAYTNAQIPIAINQIATIDASNILVTVA